MNEWKEVQLGELVDNKFCNIKNNLREPLSKMQRVKLKQGKLFPYYGAAGIIDYINDYKFEGFHLLIAEDGTVTSDGTSPMLQLVDGKFWVSNHAHILQCEKEWQTKLLYYLLRNVDINPFITGAVQPKLNKGNLFSIPFLFPMNENEQFTLVFFLSSLDDKIDLLHRQNETLEALAQTLFRQWFIERAQDDWEMGIIGDILTTKGGSTPSTKNSDFWDGDINWTSPRDLSSNDSIYLLDTERKITQAGLAKISSGLLPKGTLLMSSRAPVGYLAFSEIPISINQGYIAILDDKGFSKFFIFLWLKEYMDYVKSYANGSTFQEISKSAFRTLEVCKPPKNITQEFDKIIIPLFEKIKKNIYQVRTLENLRDTLLPRLISGAVRVRY
ncbi:MAG: restriction endonuclease subunit S [Pelolinea sp.]|nr:restriction endonuclease subunit S [Pelolinea sp.]